VTVTQTAQVTFEALAVSASNSSVVAAPATVPADGSTSSTITVTVRDQAADPQPIPGRTVTLSQGSGHSTMTTVSGTTNSSGVATFTVTDSTAESVTYTATAGGVIITSTAAVTFGNLAVSPTDSTVVASSLTADTGSSGGTTVTVTLLTAGGTQLVAGKSVTLSGTGSAVVSPSTSVVTDANGRATFTVTDLTVETVQFSAEDVTDNVAIVPTATVVFQTSGKVERLTIVTKKLPRAIAGQGYSASLIATGGNPPYAWEVVSGSLPKGIELDKSSGVLSGTTYQTGRFTFTVGVRDTKTNDDGVAPSTQHYPYPTWHYARHFALRRFTLHIAPASSAIERSP
jgi:hypothetical protein